MVTTCEHTECQARVDVHRVTRTDDAHTVKCFVAELTIKCRKCGCDFAFRGMPCGLSYDRPTTDFTATTVNLPMWPEGEVFDQDHGLIGYSVHAKGGQ